MASKKSKPQVSVKVTSTSKGTVVRAKSKGDFDLRKLFALPPEKV